MTCIRSTCTAVTYLASISTESPVVTISARSGKIVPLRVT